LTKEYLTVSLIIRYNDIFGKTPEATKSIREIIKEVRQTAKVKSKEMGSLERKRLEGFSETDQTG
jgi:hypothetical protein